MVDNDRRLSEQWTNKDSWANNDYLSEHSESFNHFDKGRRFWLFIFYISFQVPIWSYIYINVLWLGKCLCSYSNVEIIVAGSWGWKAHSREDSVSWLIEYWVKTASSRWIVCDRHFTWLSFDLFLANEMTFGNNVVGWLRFLSHCLVIWFLEDLSWGFILSIFFNYFSLPKQTIFV